MRSATTEDTMTGIRFLFDEVKSRMDCLSRLTGMFDRFALEPKSEDGPFSLLPSGEGVLRLRNIMIE